jgi:hypothetical protein
MKTNYLIALCLIFTALFLAQTVQAVESTVTKPKGLTLSPLRSELDIAPGTSLDGELAVTNSTDKTMIVSLSAEEFSVINQQYDYAFSEQSDLTKWVTFNPAEANLVSGETKKISFSVGAPLSAEPGGRYISLFAGTDTDVSDGGVSLRQRVASFLYITVLGDITRVGNLISLSSPWAVGGKSSWSVALQNTGSTHFRSRYNVQVYNLLGNGLAASMSGDTLILPGTVRSVSDDLPLPEFLGVYKIVYTIGLGDTPAVVETRFMIYIPQIVVIIGLIIIVILSVILIRKRKNKSQSV